MIRGLAPSLDRGLSQARRWPWLSRARVQAGWLGASRSPVARSGHQGSTGFTLIEVLVVLLIVSMIVTVLISGLGRVFQLRSRLAPYLDRVEDVGMLTDWVRHSIDGLVPDYDDGAHKFTGTASGFSGLTLRALDQRLGEPIPLGWELVDDQQGHTILRYHAADGSVIDAAAWTGPGVFAYQGKDHAWVDTWPPPSSEFTLDDTVGNATRVDPQLPTLIRLSGRLADHDWIVIAAPHGPTKPLSRVSDFLKMFQ
ncbi:MAG: type II secretion system protein [Acidobacteriaceae bacterium]|nr:type II secretion system protein [Acidobacteriaceae bacterium]